MLSWDQALQVTNTALYLDSKQPRPLCFVSHAHSDHLPQGHPHEMTLCTKETEALMLHRSGALKRTTLSFASRCSLDSDTELRVSSAGHVLGSAMLHVTRPEGTLLYTGDFKLRRSLTVPPAEPLTADTLVMESTYGLPTFSFPPPEQTWETLVEDVSAAIRSRRQAIVMGYSLGKAQEIVRHLCDAGLTVTCHGAVAAINDIYESLGVPLGTYRRYVASEFHGPNALDLAERGVLVAPPQVARSAFVSRFERPYTVMMSGWGLQKGAKYRYGVDDVLPLSDHADFNELLEIIDRVRPRKVYTHHGFPEFVDHLRARGIDAALAKPDPQLSLF